jgi:23S rRNA (cytidine1920-2'-O)/16S rRNA (cytidine1409-2'-O)-methyltransferase
LNKKSEKIRIDQLLVSLGLAPSRERAQAMVLAGQVLVEENRVEKPSQRFLPEAKIRLKGKDHPYVGRGGVKLQDALEKFHLDPKGKICLDIGASTGGFTDCLLQKGAARVYTLDVGSNQLDYKLRQDPRVIARENFNVRFIKAEDIPKPIDLIVIDVSFISVKLILPPLLKAIPGPWELIMLIKPQFEVGKDQVSKGGVIKDEIVRLATVEAISRFAKDCGLIVKGINPSIIKGDKGNQEYFLAGRQEIL